MSKIDSPTIRQPDCPSLPATLPQHPLNVSTRAVWSLPLLILALASCGQQIDPADVRTSESAYDDANKAFAAANFEQARQDYTVALDSGGLNVDLYVEARVKRAVALAHLSQYDDAHADLDAVLQGAADLASVFAARSFVFEKQGQTAKAEQAMKLAKQQNPRIQPFE